MLHNGEPNSLYYSLNIIRVIKSRRMRWVGHVTRMGTADMYTGFSLGRLRERDHLEDLGVDVGYNLRVGGWGGIDRIDLAQDRDRWR